jgi:hypothetical protein
LISGSCSEKDMLDGGVDGWYGLNLHISDRDFGMEVEEQNNNLRLIRGDEPARGVS